LHRPFIMAFIEEQASHVRISLSYNKTIIRESSIKGNIFVITPQQTIISFNNKLYTNRL